MELLIVIAILGVVSLIAIPSLLSMRESLDAKQSNDYAKAIFMAAQANLSKMRSEGDLAQLQPDSGNNFPAGSYAVAGKSSFPASAPGADGYAYVTSMEIDAAIYDLVLPEYSVESLVREQPVIIEYNPFTGNVYSVFCGQDSSIFVSYIGEGLPRENAELQKSMALGYYQGAITDSEKLQTANSIVNVSCKNNGEFLVTVTVALPDYMEYHDPLAFRKGLSVSLTVIGESRGSFVLDLMDHGNAPSFVEVDDSNSSEVKLTVPLDTSVTTHGHRRFANYAAGNHTTSAQDLAESAFEGKIKPGDNITIIANVELDPIGEIPDATFSSHNVGGVNPMFDSLVLVNLLDEPDAYRLQVARQGTDAYSRHVDNLSLLHNDIAQSLQTVVIEGIDDAVWNKDPAGSLPEDWESVFNPQENQAPETGEGA